MVIKERLIKFPVPDWNRVISSDLDSIAYCLCYQYDVDINNYGPYGFTTSTSLKIINDTFPNMYFYKNADNSTNVKLISVGNVKNKGAYLYGSNEKIEHLSVELDKYQIIEKKNEIKMRKSLSLDPPPAKPLISNLSNNHGYESDVIKKIISFGCGFFIYHHYMPEAGDSFILFDRELVSSLKNCALNYGIEFLEVSSINDMKSW
ncbi:hypothetical protein PL78_12130 [Yersinia entomophaga]|uniref:RES domain-containing protein n=1 Tax=Yersinia entomophaga TaxID=935293 RepID=A0ABM6BLS8_YERET|nr:MULTISPECIES: hypothetical protein [Yersinia]ANI30570.1 hypothetical protein PL78_12130 [Yersinia entomophaga]OWF86811.1 hypothetical protein B4914_13870 [Yersinia entomophaga]